MTIEELINQLHEAIENGFPADTVLSIDNVNDDGLEKSTFHIDLDPSASDPDPRNWKMALNAYEDTDQLIEVCEFTLPEHDDNTLNYCSDAIVYSESIDDHPIGSKLPDHDEWCGQYEWREQCAMMAMDFHELVHKKFDDWHDFVECAKRYFNDGRTTGMEDLETWDWFLCPAIVGRALERWKKENNQNIYRIREYHVRVLQEIFKA